MDWMWWKKFFRDIGKALFPSNDSLELIEKIAVYEPITYFDKNDPPIFLWHGGKDNQIPPQTFEKCVPMLNENKDFVIYKPDGQHDQNDKELKDTYMLNLMICKLKPCNKNC